MDTVLDLDQKLRKKDYFVDILFTRFIRYYMDIQNMEPLNGLILIVAVAGGAYLLFKIASKILKTVGIILIIGLAWFLWQGGSVNELTGQGLKLYFANTPISEMNDRFCSAERKEKVRCQCIVTPVYEDLKSRLKSKALKEIDKDPNVRYEEIRKSIGNQRKEISDCLLSNEHKGEGKEVDKIKKLLEQLFPK